MWIQWQNVSNLDSRNIHIKGKTILIVSLLTSMKVFSYYHNLFLKKSPSFNVKELDQNLILAKASKKDIYRFFLSFLHLLRLLVHNIHFKLRFGLSNPLTL